MWFNGVEDDRVESYIEHQPNRPKRVLIKEKIKPTKKLVNYYNMEGLKENIQTINEIGEEKFGKKIKSEMEGNFKGAMYGGGVGVLIALATKNNPFILGIIGLIVGRIVFKKSK
jgi:hypothetical protein